MTWKSALLKQVRKGAVVDMVLIQVPNKKQQVIVTIF